MEAVANTVGYEDSSFFGRLFRRKVGVTPAQYRKRFGGLRRALATGMDAGGDAPVASKQAIRGVDSTTAGG